MSTSAENEATEFFSILTAKTPYEATETIRIILSQAKLVNRNFYSLLRDILSVRQAYRQQLQQLISRNDDLVRLLNTQMVDNNVLTREEMEGFKFDALGDLKGVWDMIIKELKNDLRNSANLENCLGGKVIPNIRNTVENNANWEECKRLHLRLSQVASNIEFYSNGQGQGQVGKLNENRGLWESEAPYLVEMFENLNYRRMTVLKESLISYQSALNDLHSNSSKQSEDVMSKLLEFDARNEIKRLVAAANNYNFQLSPPQPSTTPAGQGASNVNQQKRRSTLGNIGHRLASSTSTVIHHDLMNNEFSNATNNSSLKGKISPSKKLKSKVGSIFGRRKNRKSQYQPQEPSILESKASSSNLQNQRRSRLQPQASNSRLSVAQSVKSQTEKRTSLKPTSHQQPPTSNNAPMTTPQNEAKLQTQAQTQAQKTFGPDVEGREVRPRQEMGEPDMSVGTPLSMSQPPLQPQHRTAYSSMEGQQPQQTRTFSNETPSQTVSNHGTTVQQPGATSPAPVTVSTAPIHIYQPGGSTPAATHVAPALPPSRKSMIARNDIDVHGVRPDGHDDINHASTNVIQERQVQIPEMQSAPVSSPSAAVVSMPSPNEVVSGPISSQITGEAKPLNPQTTGGSTTLKGQSLFQHDSFVSYGLNVSVAEVINATFKEGVLQSSQLIGEIALNYIPVKKLLPIGIHLRVKNASRFDKVIINQAFVERVDDEIFKVNPQFIDSKILGAIKYSVLEPLAPVVVHPVWKFEEHQASVVLTVKLAPFLPERIQSLTLQDVVIYVPIEGAVTTSALSKPQGSFSKEKNRITWRFKEPLVLTRGTNAQSEKFIARFMTNGMARESKDGIAIKFTIRGVSNGIETNSITSEAEGISVGSGISLESQEFDEENPFGGPWENVHTADTLTAGNYYGLS